MDDSKPIEIFDPEHTWKRKIMENYTASELLVKVFENGKLVYDLPSLEEIRNHHIREIEGMWEEVKRFTNPHNYYVDLSQNLWDVKNKMLLNRNKK